MNWKVIKKNWTAYHDQVLQSFPELGENEVIRIGGDRAKLISAVATAHELTTSEAEEQIVEALGGLMPLDARMNSTRDNEQISDSAKNIADGEDPYSDDAAFGDDDIADRPIARRA